MSAGIVTTIIYVIAKTSLNKAQLEALSFRFQGEVLHLLIIAHGNESTHEQSHANNLTIAKMQTCLVIACLEEFESGKPEPVRRDPLKDSICE